VADLHRRAEVSQTANERYLGALTAVHESTLLRQLAEPLCRPALDPARRRGGPAPVAAEPNHASRAAPAETAGADAQANARATRRRRVRALNPLATPDAALLEAVSRHEFLINGLRNRDLRGLLYEGQAGGAGEERR